MTKMILREKKIIIHNAPFDLGFINSELKSCDMSNIDENLVIDTLLLAKQKYIGQSVSLDALCRKFNIDISNRTIHGALKDAKLLSLVYLELIGGKQTRLNFLDNNESIKDDNNEVFDFINFPSASPVELFHPSLIEASYVFSELSK